MGFFNKLASLIRPKNLLSKFFYRLSQLSIISKIKANGRIIVLSYDVIAVIIAWLTACWMLVDTMADVSSDSVFLVSSYWKSILFYLFGILPPQLLLFWVFGLYRGFWRFASTQDLKKILYVSILGGMVAWIEMHTYSTGNIFGLSIFDSSNLTQIDDSRQLLPRFITSLLYTVFLIALLSSARLLVRLAKNYKHLYGDYKRVIIVGAGNAGESLVRDLLRDSSHPYKPIIFVDDDVSKIGREIHGVRVASKVSELSKWITKYDIDLVLIAIPSASSASMRSVVAICENANIPCYTLPGIKDLTDGRVNINILRSISLEDLLGRYPVTCQWAAITSRLQGKTILVTGGGGSIGSELCRQIAALGAISRLIIVDNNEYNLYSIDLNLREKFPSYQFTSELLSITDRTGIQAMLRKHRPHIVFHAAAYKHVPLLEDQPRVAMHNNIIGTTIIAEEAVKADVETFVLISSDKAVNPTNIMGATKRAAEYFCQNMNFEPQNTRFITVRFGNVLDSAGSVVPLFRKQIETGGPVTVTDPEITRFFMTIPEASQLILQSAFLGKGGEIFVLDMGDPIKIRYLAEQMIKLAGKLVQDIKIIYTGLRPGEKLYEECFYQDEHLQVTEHTKIMRAQSQRRDFKEIQRICQEISKICLENTIDTDYFIELLKKLVPEYHARSEPVDFNTVKEDMWDKQILTAIR